MPSVDDRIVRIEFDNSSFERKIDATLHSLAQLDKALQLEGAAAGLENVDKVAKGINLSSIAEGVDHIASRFSALGAVGFSAIEKLTQGAMGFASTMARKVGQDILEPIISGGKQRALNLEQAKFLFEGMGADVDKSMASAKEAVLGTAYGLDEAAKTAAQFGASGIGAGKEMTGALKGVAGVAAMTGSSFSEMSDIFTQAAGQGKISGYTLERISMRGVNVAAVMAKQMHTTEAAVRQMASDGKIDFKTFAKAMDEAFGSHAKEANKTYAGSLANLHAAMSRLGATIMTPRLEQQRDLFNAITPQVDNFTKALKPLLDMFTALSRLSINLLIKNIGKLDLSKLTAPAMYFAGVMRNIYVLFNQIRTVAGKAFKEVFPGSFMTSFTKFSRMLFEFSNRLKLSGRGASELKSIFSGFFSILKIGWTVVREGIKFFAGLLKSLLGLGGPGVVAFFAKIGDFFTNLQKNLVKGKGIEKFFQNLSRLAAKPIEVIRALARTIASFFGVFKDKSGQAAGASLGRVGDRIQSLQPIFSAFGNTLKKTWDILKKVGNAFGKFFEIVGKGISDAMSSGNYNKILDTFNTVFLGGIAGAIAYFVKHGLKVDLLGGFGDKIKGVLGEVQNTLKAFQTQIKAQAIKQIAISIAILAGSLLVLSLIDSVSLTKSLAAMTVAFGELMGAFAAINKMDVSTKDTAKFALMSAGLIIFAGALMVLTFAAAKLSKLDWNGLAKGLTGVAALIGMIIGWLEVVKTLKLDQSLIKTGLGLIALAFALDILASAVTKMAGLSWGDMAQGMIGLGVALFGITEAVKRLPKPGEMAKVGAGLLMISGGILIIAVAMRIFAGMDWGGMAKGFVGLGGSLAVIAGALQLMKGTDLIQTGQALLMVSVAMIAIAVAFKMLGGMEWMGIAKGMVAIGGAMLILAIGAHFMETALPGALAMGVMSASLVLMAAAFTMLAKVPIAGLITGLVAIAAAILIFAGLSAALSETIPAMLGIGIAMMALGAGLMFMGAAALMGALAIEALSRAAKDGAENITKALEAVGKGLPALFKGFAEGLLELATMLLQGFGKLVPLIVKALGQLLDGLNKLIPKVVKLVDELIQALLDTIVNYYSDIAKAGLDLITNFLTAIRDHIPEIVTLVGEIITGFLDALAVQIPAIIKSVVNLIRQVLEGVAKGLGELAATLWIGLGANFVKGFMDGLNQELPGLTKWFTDLLGNILGWIGDTSKTLFGDGWNLISGLFGGITTKAREVIAWFLSLAKNVLSWIGNTAMTLFSKGWDFISGLFSGVLRKAGEVASWFGGLVSSVARWVGNTIDSLFWKGWDFISGMLRGITDKAGELWSWFSGLGGTIISKIGNAFDTLHRIGNQIMEGMWNGIKETFFDITHWIGDQIGKLADPIKKFFHLKSPSRLMMEYGSNIMMGLRIGMEDEFDGIISAISKFNEDIANSVDTQPTITPVLDLTQVQADASKIQDYISLTPVTPSFSTAQASKIAADTNAAKQATSPNATDTPAGVTFTQIINAPEQLSTADIYKQTRNQITLAKEELSIP